MTSLRMVRQAAAKFGAVVVDDKIGNTHECRVEAPKGKRWKCCDVHELVDSANRPWRPDYADMLSRMAYGVEDCPDPDCEWCHPDE